MKFVKRKRKKQLSMKDTEESKDSAYPKLIPKSFYWWGQLRRKERYNASLIKEQFRKMLIL